MPKSFDPVAYNRAAWGREVENNNEWTQPVGRESFRVLRPGGISMVGFMNPDVFIFDITALDERGKLTVRHQLPFSTLDLEPSNRDHPVAFVGVRPWPGWVRAPLR